MIVLPTPLINLLDESQQKVVLAHELAHLARHGWLIRWLDIVAGGLYWWHPAVWLALRELRQAEDKIGMKVENISIPTQRRPRPVPGLAFIQEKVCLVADESLNLFFRK